MLFVCVRTVFSENHELAGDLGPAQLGVEQAEHLTLPLAQWLQQNRTRIGCVSGRVAAPEHREQSPSRLRGYSATRGRLEQDRHGRALVHEDAGVPFRFGQRQGAFQRRQGSGDLAAELMRDRLQHQDLDHASGPAPSFGRVEETVQECEGVAE